MTEIGRASLFGKLNSVGFKSIESATTFCKMRGNPYVELVHWTQQILQLEDSDLLRIVKHFNIDLARLAKEVTEALDRLPRGSTSISDFSAHVEEAVERAWTYSTLMFGDSKVRTGHLVVGILKTPSLRNVFLRTSPQFDLIKLDQLVDRFDDIVGGSPEDRLGAQDGFRLEGGQSVYDERGSDSPAQMGKQEALRRFSVDLTERARSGELDPIVGRENEIRQCVDILMRRRQNNPILTGEAGVGKTAVVEGFAQLIASGDVPPPLQNVTLRTLDLGLLQAGASMKGEFENRLRQVIEEVHSSEKPIILFVDEAHTLIGAGGPSGTGDAANLLKPALARGTLRTIAATTWDEYRKYIEKDPALTRRFQVVKIDEPSEEKAILMLRGLATKMEEHHKVQVLDEALEAAVTLSHRYIPARQLPDKAISLLDTASARVAISQHAVPAEVEDTRRRIQALETELRIIDREKAIGVQVDEREARARALFADERSKLEKVEGRWNVERDLVTQILELRGALRGTTSKVEGTDTELERAAEEVDEETVPSEKKLTPAEREEHLARLQELQHQLEEVQGETPLILASVDEQAVATVVADWTGIPVGKMVHDEIQGVLELADTLDERVIGQSHALEMISRRIQTSRAKLDNPNKPIGVFMLCGPSGVGKTETALALAEAVYGGEQNTITINMSEFQEAHTVSTLKGAPPGYVGYGEGGLLTDPVRRQPYSIVLLDEVEKAHSDVHEVFFQIFDKGVMEDSEGRLIDFKNTIILLTSNVGSDLIMNMCSDSELMPDAEGLAQALREPLLQKFPAALLGRLVVIPYYPLSDEVLGLIIKLQLGRIAKRVTEHYDIPFTYDDAVVQLIAKRCTEVESGGRMIDSILTNTVLPHISRNLLNCMLTEKQASRVNIRVENGEFAYDFQYEN